MSAESVYEQVYHLLDRHLDQQVNRPSRKRLALLVVGILHGKSAAPARVASALNSLGLRPASRESLERRVRRIENDPDVTAALCLHPLARAYLALGRPRQLLLALDPTAQADRVVMLCLAVCYRGRTLPLCWAAWPGNTPLVGERFWERVAAVLEAAAAVVPSGLTVLVLADRAFGTPAFTDLVAAHGWHYLVRCQGQTRWQDSHARTGTLWSLVVRRQRCRGRLYAFKSRGWRLVGVVGFWGRKHAGPLLLATDLKPGWALLCLYRRRYGIEACFRDAKSHGWQWEQGQVSDLEHLERLLLGMAIATWAALMLGTEAAEQALQQRSTGRRRTRPPEAKYSLFRLGLERFDWLLHAPGRVSIRWRLADWDAPNWSEQIQTHHLRAFILGRTLQPNNTRKTVRP
jgi:hypothetical protein